MSGPSHVNSVVNITGLNFRQHPHLSDLDLLWLESILGRI